MERIQWIVMRLNFHLKLAIGILLVFGLLLLGFAMWTPVRLKYYAWKYRSPDVAARVKAVDGLIRLGKPGTKKLKAIYTDGPEAVEMLIECWDDVNQRIEDRNKAFALLKLEKGWEVDSNYLYIPLLYQHVAAFNGYLETVKLLMQKGGYNNYHGRLVITKPEGKEKRKAGYKVKAGYTNKFIWGTPIHAAAFSGRNKVIDYMLSQGIDINAKENEIGWTPLYWAVIECHTKTVELLISKDTDVNAKGVYGRTVLDLAIRNKDKETQKLLRAHGAKTAAALDKLGP